MEKVPLLVYENEMKSKNRIIVIQSILIAILSVILGISIYLFVSFLSAFDFVGYDQDGDINSINSGTQGDVINGSTITNDD